MKISIYLSAAIVIGAVILQSALAPYLNINQIHPDFVAVTILALSMLREIKEAAALAFIAGALLDLLTVAPFGVFTASLLIIALLANYWQSKLAHSFSFFLPVFLALPYTIIFNLSVAILLQLSGYPIPWGSILRRIIVPAGLLNVAVMAVIYPLLYLINKAFQKEALTI